MKRRPCEGSRGFHNHGEIPYWGLLRDYEPSDEPSFQALLESLDAGKPVADSRGDLDHALTIWRYFAGWADKIHGNTLPIDGSFLSLTRKVGTKIPYLTVLTRLQH